MGEKTTARTGPGCRIHIIDFVMSRKSFGIQTISSVMHLEVKTSDIPTPGGRHRQNRLRSTSPAEASTPVRE